MGYRVTNQYGTVLVNDEATLNEPKEIRFITPDYKLKFMLPDGDHVLISHRDGRVTEHSCTFLDPYHFLLDTTPYHICQFAEVLEQGNMHVIPFPKKRMIWSNRDLNLDDWIEDLAIDNPGLDEDDYAEMMYSINDSYLDDERCNLNATVGDEIITIADLGFWYGRRMGYRLIPSGNIADCLYATDHCDYNEWYVDRDGEFRSTQTHHDGTHYLIFRKWKADASYDARDELIEKLYNGTATGDEINAVTDRLGADIGKVYGWMFPDRRLQPILKGKER